MQNSKSNVAICNYHISRNYEVNSRNNGEEELQNLK